MRYLKQLVDAIAGGQNITESLAQAQGYLERVKSFEYQGEITIRFNGDINMTALKTDLDDLMLLLADKKANESFIGEIYVVVHKELSAVPATVPATTPDTTTANAETPASQVALG